ncbi:MAG: fimbrillin family protein [Bacteroidaceae bacterium]|nr:fimbrillin family protein [Bacteroidaceae bacterium]
MRVTKSLFTIAAIFALVSCNNEWEQVVEATAQLQLSADIAPTRAGINATHFDEGDAIGVFAYSGYSGKESWNVKATTDSKSWHFEKPVNLFSESTTVYAYYPWNSYASEKHEYGFMVDATSQTNYMVGYDEGISNNNPKSQISFRHITSKVAFYITNSDAGVAIKSVTLNGEKLPVYGYYFIEACYDSLRSDATQRIYSKNISNLGENRQKAEFLLFPDSWDCTVTLTVSYDDDSQYSTEFTLPSLKENCSYAYNVNITADKKSSIEISDVVIAPWDTPATMDKITINGTNGDEPVPGTENGHEYVDLGLSVKWATCNVGASTPSDYGSYFAWGETSPKSSYYWENLKYRTSGDSYGNVKFSKYVSDSRYGTVDNKTVLELSDDAARANWGGSWRMPTISEFKELIDKCTWTWTTMNGRNGYKVVSKVNGNSIFLPAAGCRLDTSLYNAGSYGYYWSGSLGESYSYYARGLLFNSDNLNSLSYYRSDGRSVRPVLR